MSEQLDELFVNIRNGKKLLSAEEVACDASDFTRVKTEKLLLVALEDFKDRSKEDEEWEAFHAREYRKQTLEDLRQSRLTSAEPDADALLSEHGVSLDKTSALYKQLCRESLHGLADFYVNAEIIVKGDLENPSLTFSQLETSTTQPKEINPTPTGIPFAEAVMLRMLPEPCLPVHDSFIVRSGQQQRLEQVMNEEFQAATGVEAVLNQRY